MKWHSGGEKTNNLSLADVSILTESLIVADLFPIYRGQQTSKMNSQEIYNQLFENKN